MTRTHPTAAGDHRITLRFMSTPADTAAGGGSVAAGSVMEWIDKAGYACAVGWAAAYCVTAYVGNVRHRRPIAPGSLIEVQARIIHTGRTSMHVVVTVSSSEVSERDYTPGGDLRPDLRRKGRGRAARRGARVAAASRADRRLAEAALERIPARGEIKRLMLEQEYTDRRAPRATMRFLVPPMSSTGAARPRRHRHALDRRGGVRVRGRVGGGRGCRERGRRRVLGGIHFFAPVTHRRPRRGRGAAALHQRAQHASRHPRLVRGSPRRTSSRSPRSA